MTRYGVVTRALPTGLVSVGCSTAAAVTGPGPAQWTLIGMAAFTAAVIAYWGNQSEQRLEQAHKKIVELADRLTETSQVAERAHAEASRSVLDRYYEEQAATFAIHPVDDLKSTVNWVVGNLDHLLGRHRDDTA